METHSFLENPIVVMSTNVDEINLSESYKQKAKKKSKWEFTKVYQD
jgi:hypothetical protein